MRSRRSRLNCSEFGHTHRRAIYRRSIIYGLRMLPPKLRMDKELSGLLHSAIDFPSATKFTRCHSLLSDTPLTHLKTSQEVS